MNIEVMDANQLSEDDPIYILAKKLGDKFTEMVDQLKRHSNPSLSMLGKLTWKLVGKRIVPLSTMPGVPTLSFMAIKPKDQERPVGLIITPENWLDQVETDPVNSMGGVVFNASQARDFWNGKIGQPEVVDRAKAYEAEYLLGCKLHWPNKWQQQILDKFPKGLESAPELVYTGKVVWDHEGAAQ